MSTSIPIQRVMENVTMTVRVTGLCVWRVRLRLGVWLMRIAARIMGVELDVEIG